MRTFFSLLMFLFSTSFVFAQNTIHITIRDNVTKGPIAYATIAIAESKISAKTDSAGLAIVRNIPNGTQKIRISNLGYKPKELVFQFPLSDNSDQVISWKVMSEVLMNWLFLQREVAEQFRIFQHVLKRSMARNSMKK